MLRHSNWLVMRFYDTGSKDTARCLARHVPKCKTKYLQVVIEGYVINIGTESS
jgi:hypothetical protein